MTSYTTFRAHGCCSRNHPLRTKHGACPRISFRTAYLSECPQTCLSFRLNHLAPFRNLQLLLRRHNASGTRATTADRWCSTLGKCALRRAFLPVHLASSSATGRSTGLCTSGCRRRPYSTCLACFRLFRCNLHMSFVSTHTSMIDVADLSMFRFLQTPSWAAKPSAAMAVERAAEVKALVLKRPSAQPKDTELLWSTERNLVYTSGYKRKYRALIKEGVDKTNALAEARISGQEAVSIWMAS